MARLFVGLLVGAALAAGGAYFYARRSGTDLRDPCLGRCGAQTRCERARCVAEAAKPAPVPTKRRRHARHDGVGPAQPEETLRPGDDRMATEGDALGRPERVDFSKESDDGHELSQDDLDRVFHRVQGEISRCIGDAVGDAPLDTGRVEVAFRVERAGSVGRVRISAPQLLLRKGLSRCVRPLVTGLTFPRSGGASVVTYPFQLQ
jgi:hypothetical protein